MRASYIVSSKHKPYGLLKIIVKRRDGSIKYVKEQRVDSLTRFVWDMLRSCIGAGVIPYTDVTGASQTISSDGTTVHFATSYGVEVDIGVVIGTGIAPVLVTNHYLNSIVPHGSGAGEMQRSVSETSLGDLNYTITRVFENVGGSTIDIAEAGVISAVVADPVQPIASRRVLICRDLIEPAVPVEDGESATVVYDLFFATGNRNIAVVWEQFAKGPSMTTNHGNRAVTFWRANGTSTTMNFGPGLRADAAPGQARGIFLGDGTTSPEITDIDLDNLITHGTGAGQLLYGTSQATNILITNDDERIEFDMTRVITNDSGGDVIIREMGLFSNTSTSDMGTRTMLDRYVLPAPVTLAHGESRLARWLFRYAI